MNRLIVNGLDLTEMGICDVGPLIDTYEAEIALAEHYVRQILGSITFGPKLNESSLFVEIFDTNETNYEDFDWEYAE